MVVVCGGSVWWWCVVVVVVQASCMTHVSVDMRQRDASNWVVEHMGASSRRPRHPFPALMAGETPGRVPVYTALKTHPIIPRRAENCNCGEPQFLHNWTPWPVTHNGHVTTDKNCTCARTTWMVMSPYRYTSHCILRHLSINLNQEKLELSGQISS